MSSDEEDNIGAAQYSDDDYDQNPDRSSVISSGARASRAFRESRQVGKKISSQADTANKTQIPSVIELNNVTKLIPDDNENNSSMHEEQNSKNIESKSNNSQQAQQKHNQFVPIQQNNIAGNSLEVVENQDNQKNLTTVDEMQVQSENVNQTQNVMLNQGVQQETKEDNQIAQGDTIESNYQNSNSQTMGIQNQKQAQASNEQVINSHQLTQTSTKIEQNQIQSQLKQQQQQLDNFEHPVDPLNKMENSEQPQEQKQAQTDYGGVHKLTEEFPKLQENELQKIKMQQQEQDHQERIKEIQLKQLTFQQQSRQTKEPMETHTIQQVPAMQSNDALTNNQDHIYPHESGQQILGEKLQDNLQIIGSKMHIYKQNELEASSKILLDNSQQVRHQDQTLNEHNSSENQKLQSNDIQKQQDDNMQAASGQQTIEKESENNDTSDIAGLQVVGAKIQIQHYEQQLQQSKTGQHKHNENEGLELEVVGDNIQIKQLEDQETNPHQQLEQNEQIIQQHQGSDGLQVHGQKIQLPQNNLLMHDLKQTAQEIIVQQGQIPQHEQSIEHNEQVQQQAQDMLVLDNQQAENKLVEGHNKQKQLEQVPLNQWSKVPSEQIISKQESQTIVPEVKTTYQYQVTHPNEVREEKDKIDQQLLDADPHLLQIKHNSLHTEYQVKHDTIDSQKCIGLEHDSNQSNHAQPKLQIQHQNANNQVQQHNILQTHKQTEHINAQNLSSQLVLNSTNSPSYLQSSQQDQIIPQNTKPAEHHSNDDIPVLDDVHKFNQNDTSEPLTQLNKDDKHSIQELQPAGQCQNKQLIVAQQSKQLNDINNMKQQRLQQISQQYFQQTQIQQLKDSQNLPHINSNENDVNNNKNQNMEQIIQKVQKIEQSQKYQASPAQYNNQDMKLFNNKEESIYNVSSLSNLAIQFKHDKQIEIPQQSAQHSTHGMQIAGTDQNLQTNAVHSYNSLKQAQKQTPSLVINRKGTQEIQKVQIETQIKTNNDSKQEFSNKKFSQTESMQVQASEQLPQKRKIQLNIGQNEPVSQPSQGAQKQIKKLKTPPQLQYKQSDLQNDDARQITNQVAKETQRSLVNQRQQEIMNSDSVVSRRVLSPSITGQKPAKPKPGQQKSNSGTSKACECIVM